MVHAYNVAVDTQVNQAKKGGMSVEREELEMGVPMVGSDGY